MLVGESELVISYFAQNIIERLTSPLVYILRISRRIDMKTMHRF